MMKVSNDIEEIDEEIDDTPEHSGIGTGWAMLIGSGLTLTAIAVGKKAKKLWQDRKTKRETATEEEPVVIDVESEVVEETTKPEPPAEKPKEKGKK